MNKKRDFLEIQLKLSLLMEFLESAIEKRNLESARSYVNELNNRNVEFLNLIIKEGLEKTILISIYSNINFVIKHFQQNITSQNFKGLKSNVETLCILLKKLGEETKKFEKKEFRKNGLHNIL